MDISHVSRLHIFCCYCGSYNRALNKFCRRCGTKISIALQIHYLKEQGATEEEISYLLLIHGEDRNKLSCKQVSTLPNIRNETNERIPNKENKPILSRKSDGSSILSFIRDVFYGIKPIRHILYRSKDEDYQRTSKKGKGVNEDEQQELKEQPSKVEEHKQTHPHYLTMHRDDLLNKEKVLSSIYAPAESSRGDFMMIQVYLYKDDEQDQVAAKAKEVDSDAVRKNFTPLDVPVKTGDKVTALLHMSGKGLVLDETDMVMIWQDHYTDCRFSVYVPVDYIPQSVVGTVTLSVNGAPAGRMMFKSKIVDAPCSLYAEVISHKFNKIFISYSHNDEDKVKYIHQAYEALNVEHFFDRAYLKPGDVYPEKIKDYIASADLFILCWSENAKNSHYVQLEIADAMKRAYPGVDMDKATLAIHPLDIEPHAELPEEMNKVYHFGRM